MKHIFSILLAVLLLAGAFIISPSGVRASNVTFTSTADFDAGAKNNPGDGSYGVETASDNLAVPANAFELANVGGDEFSLASSGSTFKWTYSTAGTGAAQCTESIGSGTLNFGSSDNNGKDCIMSSTGTCSGDWDFRTLYSTTVGGSDGTVRNDLCLLDSKNLCYPQVAGYTGSPNGVVAMFVWSASAHIFRAYKVISGTQTQLGTDASVVCSSCYLRITRATDTFTFYYSSDGSSWTQYEQTSVTSPSVPANLYANLDFILAAQTTGSASSTFDHFSMASGTINAGGYRTSGNWLSAGQTPTADLFRSIFLNYSGASSNDYVTAVALVSGTGGYPYVDNTDLTSSSSHTYTVPVIQLSGSWKVQVNLTGDGSGSVVVDDIIVVHTVNVAPSLSPSLVSDTATVNASYSRVFSATDPDNQTLTWNFSSDNPYLHFGASNHTVYGVPRVLGSFWVNVSANDSMTETFGNYTLDVIPPPPGLSPFSAVEQGWLVFIAFLFLFALFLLVGLFADIPPFVAISGIVLIVFGFWFLTAAGFGVIPVVMWTAGAFVFLLGILYSFGMGD